MHKKVTIVSFILSAVVRIINNLKKMFFFLKCYFVNEGTVQCRITVLTKAKGTLLEKKCVCVVFWGLLLTRKALYKKTRQACHSSLGR